jgi:hypothetical protein
MSDAPAKPWRPYLDYLLAFGDRRRAVAGADPANDDGWDRHHANEAATAAIQQSRP